MLSLLPAKVASRSMMGCRNCYFQEETNSQQKEESKKLLLLPLGMHRASAHHSTPGSVEQKATLEQLSLFSFALLQCCLYCNQLCCLMLILLAIC